MPAPRFSVVIPTHQAAAFIGRTIQCVLDQTIADYEIVIVDNGSTDGTDAIVAAFGDPRITYRWQEDSGRPANTRNVAISLAKGEYVAFLDADDLWVPTKLERVEATLDSGPGIDLVAHGVRVVTPGGRVVGERVYELAEGDPYAQLLYRGNFLTTSAVTVRRSILIAEDCFDERDDYVTCEDYDLWLRIARDGGRLAVLTEILGDYMAHSGGASADLGRHYDNQFHVLDAHYGALAATGDLDVRAALYRRTRARLALVRGLAMRGRHVTALRYLARIPGERSAAARSWEQMR
jgi:teichuronic acid biosynthesis glycosyltransferase TuaG